MTLDRAVLMFAGLMVLASLALGYFVSPWWYLLTAFVGLNSPEDALALLNLLQSRAGNAVTGFEIMSRLGMEFDFRHLPGARDPLSEPHPWYALIELSSPVTGGEEGARRRQPAGALPVRRRGPPPEQRAGRTRGETADGAREREPLARRTRA